MSMVKTLAAALLLVAAPAFAGNYVVQCTAPCTASDGTTQPTGTVLNRILADPSYVPGAGLALAPDTGQAVYAPPAPTLTLPQQAMVALTAPLAVTSTATPSINASYAIDATTRDNMNAEVTSILLNGTFADGTASVAWPDTGGTPHAMTVPQFKSFASAVAAYVAALYKVAQGTLSTLPPATVAIP